MHEAAYRELGIDAVYQRLPIPPELFAETVRALPGSGFSGINVTIPHKSAAAELADTRSDAAQAIGAANTLTFTNDQIHAENTDAPALIAAIDHPLGGARALLLGAGGTARAAAWALKAAGAEVFVHNRTVERANVLASEFGVAVAEHPSGGAGYELIVNTTSVGMDPALTQLDVCAQLGIDFHEVANDALVVDFVYRDGGSPLADAAAEAGLRSIGGAELLARQGALSFEHWLDRPAPLAVMLAAASAG